MNRNDGRKHLAAIQMRASQELTLHLPRPLPEVKEDSRSSPGQGVSDRTPSLP